MANLTIDGDSDYTTTGTPDSATVLSDGPSGTDALAAHINGIARAVVELQALLGHAGFLRGDLPDLETRLVRMMDYDGTFQKGVSFPGSPIDGQPFYRTDLNVLYIYDAGTTSWIAGSDSGAFALIDGSRDFTGDIKINKNAPALRLKGTEGSGLDLQFKESAGILILSRNTGTEAIPVWTEYMRVNPATGEISTLLTKLTGTGNFKAILTHSNAADRTYTLQDSSDTLVGRATTDTLTNKTLTSPVVTGNTIGTGAIKTAAGSASGASTSALNITMNQFAFFPALGNSNSLGLALQTYAATDPSNTVGRFTIVSGGGGGGTSIARWDYFTASDDPTIWVAVDDLTGEIKAVWVSDDPIPGNIPGVLVDGCTSVQMKAEQLEHITELSSKVAQAQDYIRDGKLKMRNLAYRSLQLHAGDAAPSKWLFEHCSMDSRTGLLKVEPIKKPIEKTVVRKRTKK